jgi:hypothetical protein
MLQIKKEEINDLLTIIPRDYPCFDIFHLSTEENDLSHQLEAFALSQNYSYDMFIADDEFFKKRRYNSHAKIYDILFIQIDLNKVKEIELFYKKLYPISKNGAKILFITELDYDIYTLQEVLIEKNYVAVNPIEDTFENYKILSAQKMHGWGN